LVLLLLLPLPRQVGYVSPDLFTHSVSYFAEAPLCHHSSKRIQLFVYSCVAKPDAKTLRLQQKVMAAGGTWRDVARLTEPQLAQLIRQDEVDILVELTGGSLVSEGSWTACCWNGLSGRTTVQKEVLCILRCVLQV
jgi:predicted O-linked N-acetylglucosamine transferase (SPINDLY family)